MIFEEPKMALLLHCYDNPLLEPLFLRVYSVSTVSTIM